MDGCGELIVTAWEGDCSRHQIRHLSTTPHCAVCGKENDGILFVKFYHRISTIKYLLSDHFDSHCHMGLPALTCHQNIPVVSARKVLNVSLA